MASVKMCILAFAIERKVKRAGGEVLAGPAAPALEQAGWSRRGVELPPLNTMLAIPLAQATIRTIGPGACPQRQGGHNEQKFDFKA